MHAPRESAPPLRQPEAARDQVAEVRWVKPDKNGLIVGACDIPAARRGEEDARGGQGGGGAGAGAASVFFFHGTPAQNGFKCGGNAGRVESAGLQLAAGDRLFQVRTLTRSGGAKDGEQQLASGTIFAPRANAPRFADYLSGLVEVRSN